MAMVKMGPRKNGSHLMKTVQTGQQRMQGNFAKLKTKGTRTIQRRRTRGKPRNSVEKLCWIQKNPPKRRQGNVTVNAGLTLTLLEHTSTSRRRGPSVLGKILGKLGVSELSEMARKCLGHSV